MAVRACVVEGKGDVDPAKLKEHQNNMAALWKEISDLADFDHVNISYRKVIMEKVSNFVKMYFRMAKSR